jgi:hypothetical protein
MAKKELVFDAEVTEALPSIDAVDAGFRQQCAMAQVDSSETLVFARQLEQVASKVFKTQYPELKSASLIPTNNEVSEGVEFYPYRIWDEYVMAKIVGNYSTDYPLVNASAREVTTTFFKVGDAFMHSIDDLRAAARAGVPLSSLQASLARRGIELAREDIAAIGVPEKGTYGLANHPNVTVAVLPTGDWANPAVTGLEILGDLNYLLTTGASETNEIIQFDTVILPYSLYRHAELKLLNDANSSNVSVLQMFKSQNPGVSVVSWNKLETAGADGGPRIVAYKRSSDILEFLVQTEFETFPPEYRALTWTTYCRGAFGGVVVYQPAGLLYSDSAA